MKQNTGQNMRQKLSFENKIVVEDLSKKFKIGFKKRQSALARFAGLFSGKEPKKILEVLKGVCFKVDSGEILGIVGKNGSGKTTLLRILAGIYMNYKGKVIINGILVPIIGLGIGMQSRLTMRENIFLVGSLFGLSQKDIKNRFNSIVEFSELENFINTKLYQFSSGMLQRLAFSIAIYCNPEILLLDEVFEVGDLEFRRRSANKIKELAKKGTSVILVSHQLWMIEKYCDEVVWLDKGVIKKQGKPKKVLNDYKKGL